jgi:hypothetical protein
MFMMLAVLAFSAAATATARSVNGGTCQYLSFASVALRLNSTCSSVVNYEYFLPTGYTNDHLNSVAFTRLKVASLGMLPVACQEAMKGEVCASVYLRCLPEGSVDSSTYADYDLAFQRPCKSLCTPVASTCLGVLKLFSLTPNCSATTDYSFGNLSAGQMISQFDSSNDDTCNSLVNATVSVGSLRESYMFSKTGACSGIIADPIFIPPAHLIKNTLAPMQPPGQVQIAVESQLKSTFQLIATLTPSTSCRYALRKAACGLYFLKSEMELFGSALTTPMKTQLAALGVSVGSLAKYNMSVPSYPEHSVCTDYLSACTGPLSGQIISVLTSQLMNCTGKTAAGVSKFPISNQTVVSVPVNTVTSLTFSTAPNKMTDSYDNGILFVTPTYSCVSPTEAFGSNPERSTCSRVVDYDFLLPSTHDLNYLNEQALGKLNTTALSVLPNACIIDVMRVACAMVYRKCPSGIDTTNQQTWNYDIYSDINLPVPMPFQRPCRSVCDDLNRHCYGMLALFAGQLFDCSSDRFDYSGGIVSVNPQPLQFDQADDVTVCNDVSAAFEVSEGSETYIFQSSTASRKPSFLAAAADDDVADDSDSTGFCDGITTELWVPPAANVDLAPLQDPYIVQDTIENKLLNVSDKLRVYLSSECRFAIRKLVCGSVYLLPQAVNVGALLADHNISTTAMAAYLNSIGGNFTELMDHTFYVPSFPNRSVCTDFQTACPLVVAQSVNSSSLLSSTCTDDDTSAMGPMLFPSRTQVVGHVNLHWDNETNEFSNTTFTALALYSEPNDMSDAVDSEDYSPSCPSGYVIPERPDDSAVKWVSGTACAVSCSRPALFKSGVWDFVYSARAHAPLFLSIILLVFLIICMIHDKNRHERYLVILFASSCLINVLVGIIVFAKNYHTEGSAFCSNNAVPFDPNADESNDTNGARSICSAQAVILMYTLLFNCVCCLMMSLEVFFDYVVPQYVERLYYYDCIYVVLIFGLPLISLIMQTSTRNYGYQIPLTYCMNKYALGSNNKYLPEREYFYKPLIVYTALGVVVLIMILATAIKRCLFGDASKAENQAVPASSSAPAVVVVVADSAEGKVEQHAAVDKQSSANDVRPFALQRHPPLRKDIFTLIFLALMNILWISIIAIKFINYDHHADKMMHTQGELKALTKCIFAAYDGTDDSWQSVCDEEVPQPTSFLRQTQWVRFCMFGQAFVVSAVFTAAHIYWNFFKQPMDDEVASPLQDDPSFRKNQIPVDAVSEASCDRVQFGEIEMPSVSSSIQRPLASSFRALDSADAVNVSDHHADPREMQSEMDTGLALDIAKAETVHL